MENIEPIFLELFCCSVDATAVQKKVLNANIFHRDVNNYPSPPRSEFCKWQPQRSQPTISELPYNKVFWG